MVTRFQKPWLFRDQVKGGYSADMCGAEFPRLAMCFVFPLMIFSSTAHFFDFACMWVEVETINVHRYSS